MVDKKPNVEDEEDKDEKDTPGEETSTDEGREKLMTPPPEIIKLHFEEKGAWALYIMDDFDKDSYDILEVVLKKAKKQFKIKEKNDNNDNAPVGLTENHTTTTRE